MLITYYLTSLLNQHNNKILNNTLTLYDNNDNILPVRPRNFTNPVRLNH